jgi:hypothetical protein
MSLQEILTSVPAFVLAWIGFALWATRNRT